MAASNWIDDREDRLHRFDTSLRKKNHDDNPLAVISDLVDRGYAIELVINDCLGRAFKSLLYFLVSINRRPTRSDLLSAFRNHLDSEQRIKLGTQRVGEDIPYSTIESIANQEFVDFECKKTYGRFWRKSDRNLAEESAAASKVYLCFDQCNGREYAVKELGDENRSFANLRNEFLKLYQCTHKNIVNAYRLNSVPVPDEPKKSKDYLLLEFVDGTDIEYFCINKLGRASESVLELFRQSIVALAYLHSKGFAHLDIKPSNILVETKAGINRVIFLDFGSSASISKHSKEFQTLGPNHGTAGFMSPQMMEYVSSQVPARNSGQFSFEKSDVFSLGVVFAKCLGCRVDLRDYAERARRLVNHEGCLVAPDQFPQGTSKKLVELCTSMCQFSESDRASLDEILSVVASDQRSELIADEPVSQGGFAGRKRELTELELRLSGARESNSTTLVDLVAPSGVGKSELVNQFLNRLDKSIGNQIPVLKSTNYASDTAPFNSLEPFVKNILRHLDSLSQEVRFCLLDGLNISYLKRIYHREFKRFETKTYPDDNKTTPEIGREAAKIFKELLTRICNSSEATVIILDNVQWMDKDSRQEFARLFSKPFSRLLLLRISQTEISDRIVFPVAAINKSVLELGNLGVEEIESLLENTNRIESKRKYYSKKIHNLTHGHAFYVSRILRLKKSEFENLLDSEDSKLDYILLKSTSAPALRLLCTVANNVVPIPDELAFSVSQTGEEEFKELYLDGLITSGHLQTIEISHDLIRKAVFELAPEICKVTAQNLANYYQNNHKLQARPEIMVHLYGQLGEHEKVLNWSLTGAKQSLDRMALVASLKFAELGLGFEERFTRSLNTEEIFELRITKAHALSRKGEIKESADEFLEAANKFKNQLTAEKLEQIYSEAGKRFLWIGDTENAMRAYKNVLPNYGISIPTTRLGSFLSIGISRIWQILLQPNRIVTRNENAAVVARLCWGIAGTLGMVDNFASAAIQTSHLRYAFFSGDPLAISRALSVEVAYANADFIKMRKRIIGLIKLSKKYASLQINGNSLEAEREQKHAIGFLREVIGVTHFVHGNWQRANRSFESSIKHFKKNKCEDVHWELDTANSFIAWGQYFRGDLKWFRQNLQELTQNAEDRGAMYAKTNMSILGGHLIDLANDQPDKAERSVNAIMDRWPKNSFFYSTFNPTHGSSTDFSLPSTAFRSKKPIERKVEPLSETTATSLSVGSNFYEFLNGSLDFGRRLNRRERKGVIGK